jgi:Fibronectin type III domain
MDIGAELKGKVGPFPLYVWLLGMTGLAVVAYMVFKKKSTQPTTGTPGTPCTQPDGSAGVWDSSGTVCQATTVSTVNVPGAGVPGMNVPSGQGTWSMTTTPAGTAAASTPAAVAATTPPEAPPVSTSTTGPTSPKAVMPAMVTGLHATSVAKTSIGLAWNRAANAQTYQVRVTYQSKVQSTAMTTGTSYTVTGLKANQTYGLHVVAINGSNWAPEASITQKTKA